METSSLRWTAPPLSAHGVRMSGDIEILRVGRPGAIALAGELARVYGLAALSAGCDEPRTEAERFRTEQLPLHAGRDAFRCVVARRTGRTVGFGYGYTGQRGQWWSDWVAPRVPDVLADDWIGGHFELVELIVNPAERGLGIGTALHDVLMMGLPHRHGLLSVCRDDQRALRLYRARGWILLCGRFDAAFDLYGRRLTPSSAEPPVTTPE